MNREICEREQEISAAFASGMITAELASHAQRCRACSDIVLVGGFLQSKSDLSARELSAVPDPGLIWRKAQWRATERAVRLASRPIRWMTILAYVAFVCSPWLRLLLPSVRDLGSSWSTILDSNLASLSKLLPAAPNGPIILFGMSGTLILLGLSSWLMWREE